MPLGAIDISAITDLSCVFSHVEPNKDGNIAFDFDELPAFERRNFRGLESWDVAHVNNMEFMFCKAIYFDCDISNWDVSRVVKMDGMFRGCVKFNKSLDDWDVSSVKGMGRMFKGCEVLTTLPGWYTSSSNSSKKYFPKTKKKLKKLLKNENIPLNSIDISAISDLSNILDNLTSLRSKNFKGLESWDISHTDADTHYSWASLYEEGECVKRDYSKAVEYYRKAGDMGDAWGYFDLACMYDNGQGVPQSDSTAVEYYQKAAELGNADACFSLALMYGDGQGVPQDYQKAIEYYQKAADMGHAVAFLALGVLYENGQGVAQDYDKARRYFQKAVEIGDEEVKQLAQDFLNKLWSHF